MNAVIATTAILYRVLPSESKLETTRPQTIGPINEDARSARLKYAKARLCFPLGAIEDINERETAQLEPNHNPMMVVATTNTTKFVASPMRGNRITHPERMNKSVRLCPHLSAMYPDSVPPIAEVIKIPSKMYVFIVSETPQTCSRNMGKLLEAVRMASLNRK